ncbi:hypothetical protein BH09SUM1_BH09SUM1_29560 [soil metagenome]
MRQTPLFSEPDPFPPWLRRMYPQLARIDQNPLFAASYDFAQRKYARRHWFLRRVLPWLILATVISAAVWIINSHVMRGPMMPLIINMPVYIFVFAFRKRGIGRNRNFLYDERLHEVPISARDALDASIAMTATGLRWMLPAILVISIGAGVALGIFLPAWFPLRWEFAVMAAVLLLTLARLFLWLQAGVLCHNMVVIMLAGIGAKAGYKRFVWHNTRKVLLRVVLPIFIGVVVFQAIVVLWLVKLKISGETIAAIALTAVVIFCAWQFLFFRGRKRAGRHYRWSEAILREAIPMHIRQAAGDTIDPAEMERLLELLKRPIKSA